MQNIVDAAAGSRGPSRLDLEARLVTGLVGFEEGRHDGNEWVGAWVSEMIGDTGDISGRRSPLLLGREVTARHADSGVHNAGIKRQLSGN